MKQIDLIAQGLIIFNRRGLVPINEHEEKNESVLHTILSRSHRFLLQNVIESHGRRKVVSPLEVDLRTEPPVRDEDLLLGVGEGVCHGGHEAAAVNEPAGFLKQRMKCLIR